MLSYQYKFNDSTNSFSFILISSQKFAYESADLHISIPNIDNVESVPLICFVGIIACLLSNGDTNPPVLAFKALTYAMI